MRRDRGRLSTKCSAALLALVLGGVAGWALAGDEDEVPRGWREFVEPVATGDGAGKAFFPSVDRRPGSFEILDPRGFEVHMTSADDPGDELVFPAGVPVPMPGGRWRIWLQGPGVMSERTVLSNFSGHTPRPGSVSVFWMPVGHAGRVVLPDRSTFERDHELWVIHADSPPGHRHELSRRRPLSEVVGDGVLMPAGTALAALWDPEDERYLALSRPFEVEAGGEVSAAVREPAPGRAHLLVFAEYPGEGDVEGMIGLAPTIARGRGRRRPDATVETAWGVYSVWYDLPPGPVLLADGNRSFYVEAQSVKLVGDEVERLDVPLLQRPFLEVGLILPARLREGPLELSVRSLSDGEDLATSRLRRDAGRHRFESLVQAPLEVILDTHLGRYREEIDLTGMVEGFVTLQPSLIELSGAVSRGGEPIAAEIELETVAGERVEATTGEDGAYRTLALQPIRALSVHLPDTPGDPWLHAFARPVTESLELDLALPPAVGEKGPTTPAAPDPTDREPEGGG